MSGGYWVQRNERQRAERSREWVPGPVRRAFTKKRTGFGGPHRQTLRASGSVSQSKPKLFFGKGEFKRTWIPPNVGRAGKETGTKLYISNLNYRIKYPDIDGLFSKIGKLKHCKVHYDRTGQPNGSAEVVYERRADAINAWQHYNDSLLAGRIMKVVIVDNDVGQSMTRNIKVASDVMNQRKVIMLPHTFAGSAPVYKGNRRFNHGNLQPERIRRNRFINIQRSRPEVVDIPEDEFRTEFENLRVERTYF